MPYQYLHQPMLVREEFGIVNKYNIMNLLTIQEIINVIDNKTKNVDPEYLDGVILKHKNISNKNIDVLLKRLQLDNLPQDFQRLIIEYNWGDFSILNIQFGNGDENSLDWISKYNLDYYNYNNLKEEKQIIIANGDPGTALLDIQKGTISFFNSEIDLKNRIEIAPNFDFFVRGLGTALFSYWNDEQEDFIYLAKKEFGEQSLLFWRSTISFY